MRELKIGDKIIYRGSKHKKETGRVQLVISINGGIINSRFLKFKGVMGNNSFHYGSEYFKECDTFDFMGNRKKIDYKNYGNGVPVLWEDEVC